MNKTNIIRTMNSKWQHYWCILMKDYIIFNRQPDDKTPKDYILLKNFTLQKTPKQLGFKLIDNIKNIEHEFYAENSEEFRDWYQYLSEIKAKVNNDCSSSTCSPLLTQQQSLNKTDNSSRESSPLGSPGSKMASRDSSPSLTYRMYR